MRSSLGKLPDGFVTYWLRRFPLLLPHVWLQMQAFRHEDILHTYYPPAFTVHRDDVPELNAQPDYTDIEENQLFVKSKVYVDETEEPRYKKMGSPRRNNNNDWRSEDRGDVEYRYRSDDVRLRDRQYYKRKEKKRDTDVPVWSLPPQ